MAKKKGSRAGGKYTGSHTTVVPGAAIIADIAHAHGGVTKIAIGYIKAGLPSAKGVRRLKITADGASLLLAVRDRTSHQELHVYATDLALAMREIGRAARREGFEVSVAKAP